MVPMRDFSGLINCAWALARAAAIVPIASLERCTANLRVDEVEADGARFRALGTNAMTDCFFGILRHQHFQLSLASLMIEKSLPGAAEQAGKFGPGIRSAHIHNPDRFDPRRWWFNTEDARGLAALNTAPELPLSRDNQVLVERIGMGRDFDPFAAAGNH